MVYPPGFDIDQLTQQIETEKKTKAQIMQDEKAQKDKEAVERSEIEHKLRENYDPQLTIILTEMQTLLGKLANSRLEYRKRKPLRVKLEGLRGDLKAREQRLEVERSTPREPAAKTPKLTLKSMLSSQKEELAAKMRPEPKSAPVPRSDVYEVPSSGESDSDSGESDSDSSSDSDSDSGDIMPDGQSAKLRKPWGPRSS